MVLVHFLEKIYFKVVASTIVKFCATHVFTYVTLESDSLLVCNGESSQVSYFCENLSNNTTTTLPITEDTKIVYKIVSMVLFVLFDVLEIHHKYRITKMPRNPFIS